MCQRCKTIFRAYHAHGWQHELFPKAGTQFGEGWCCHEASGSADGKGIGSALQANPAPPAERRCSVSLFKRQSKSTSR